MSSWFWKAVFVVASVALAAALGGLIASADHLWFYWRTGDGAWSAFGVGFGMYVAAWALLLRRWPVYRFIATLDHELVHVGAALLTGARVVNMNVSALGQGAVTVERSNPLVAIAPYLVSVPLIAGLAAVAASPRMHAVHAAEFVGVLGAYHLLRIAETCRPSQPDFRATTFPVGLAWVIACNALLAGLAVSVMTARAPGAVHYTQILVHGAYDLSEVAVREVSTRRSTTMTDDIHGRYRQLEDASLGTLSGLDDAQLETLAAHGVETIGDLLGLTRGLTEVDDLDVLRGGLGDAVKALQGSLPDELLDHHANDDEPFPPTGWIPEEPTDGDA